MRLTNRLRRGNDEFKIAGIPVIPALRDHNLLVGWGVFGLRKSGNPVSRASPIKCYGTATSPLLPKAGFARPERYVRQAPKADINPRMFDVRSSPGSGHRQTAPSRPLCANRRHRSGVKAGLWDRISYSIRADAHRCSDRSGTHFEDHVERRLGRAAEALEARFSRDLTQSAFTRLGTEPQAHFLRE